MFHDPPRDPGTHQLPPPPPPITAVLAIKIRCLNNYPGSFPLHLTLLTLTYA